MSAEKDREPLPTVASPAPALVGAVFLSYASEDAAAAERIAIALRNAGVEVWFDQSELRGGDVWDAAIRKHIKSCALFIPVISASTHARKEGYFRLEWKLAVDRSHLMSPDQAFLLPVAIDNTPQSDERIPDRFRELQWTRLPSGETPLAFVERVRKLLSPEPLAARAVPTPLPLESAGAPTLQGLIRSHRRSRLALWAIGAVLAVGVAYLVVDRLWVAKHSQTAPVTEKAASSASPPPATTVAFNPPPHSVAVLPFVDMSEKHDQEYFSDGLSEELIDLLSKVPDLRVPARTSSFYFKSKQATIPEIAKALSVAHVLEGSVRKSGKKLRVTAQLIRTTDGYHMWSESYDRELKDVFQVQDEIAAAVVSAMKSKLSSAPVVPAARRTSNPEAYSQYLIGKSFYERAGVENYRRATEALRKSVALDPRFGPAYAQLGMSELALANDGDRLTRADVEHAVAYVDRAIALAPDLAEGYSVRGNMRMQWLLDLPGAQSDLLQALSLEPNSSVHLRRYARVLLYLGHVRESLAPANAAVQADPLDMFAWLSAGLALTANHRFADARAAYERGLQISPDAQAARGLLADLDIQEGRTAQALALYRTDTMERGRLGSIAAFGDARESQQALEELIRKVGPKNPYAIATVLAWRGEKEKAFEWLERAYKQRDPDLVQVKVDWMLKSLHADSRFNALLRNLNLAD